MGREEFIGSKTATGLAELLRRGRGYEWKEKRNGRKNTGPAENNEPR